MYKTICNPKIKKKYCMSDNITYKLKEKWNNKNTRKIKEESPYKILFELFSLNSKCENELCILKTFFSIHDQNFVDELDNYAPIAPETWKKNKNTWLTTKDIKNVLNQYDKLYTNFRFIGPSPIDWFEKAKTTNSCICRYLCELNYDNLIKEGIEKVGIVFNLDEHYKKGSHRYADEGAQQRARRDDRRRRHGGSGTCHRCQALLGPRTCPHHCRLSPFNISRISYGVSTRVHIAPSSRARLRTRSVFCKLCLPPATRRRIRVCVREECP